MARRRGQQKGYVHRQGNAWYAAYREDALDENGNIIRVRRNERIADAKEVSKREAQRIARDILTRVDEQAQRPSSLITVEQFIKARFEPDVIWSLKHAGKKHYGYILGKHVIPAMGQMRLRDVSSDHVQELLRMKITAGFSVQTAVHVRNAISAVFKHAKLKRAHHGDNPVVGTRLPEMQRREKHALSFEQGRCLLAALEYPTKEMALLSMTASLNVAEMSALRWKRINLTAEPVIAEGEIIPPFSLAVRENFYDGKFGSLKAASRRRNVPLSSSMAAALLDIRRRSKFVGPDDLVFASRRGHP